MTPIGEAVTRSRHRDLGRGTDAELPFKDLFGKGVRRGIDLNDEFVCGPDTTDDSSCGNRLPEPGGMSCAQPPPWVSVDWKDTVNASGADRVRRIGLSTEEGSTAAGRSAARSVSYVEVDMAGSDRSHRVPPRVA